MDRFEKCQIDEIDDLTIKLATLRLSKSRKANAISIVLLLNELQRVNSAFKPTMTVALSHHSLHEAKAVGFVDKQDDALERETARYQYGDGWFVSFGEKVVERLWFLVRLFGRPAS